MEPVNNPAVVNFDRLLQEMRDEVFPNGVPLRMSQEQIRRLCGNVVIKHGPMMDYLERGWQSSPAPSLQVLTSSVALSLIATIPREESNSMLKKDLKDLMVKANVTARFFAELFIRDSLLRPQQGLKRLFNIVNSILDLADEALTNIMDPIFNIANNALNRAPLSNEINISIQNNICAHSILGQFEVGFNDFEDRPMLRGRPDLQEHYKFDRAEPRLRTVVRLFSKCEYELAMQNNIMRYIYDLALGIIKNLVISRYLDIPERRMESKEHIFTLVMQAKSQLKSDIGKESEGKIRNSLFQNFFDRFCENICKTEASWSAVEYINSIFSQINQALTHFPQSCQKSNLCKIVDSACKIAVLRAPSNAQDANAVLQIAYNAYDQIRTLGQGRLIGESEIDREIESIGAAQAVIVREAIIQQEREAAALAIQMGQIGIAGNNDLGTTDPYDDENPFWGGVDREDLARLY